MSRFTGFPPEVKAAVLERSGGRCEVCNFRQSDMEYHHRRPRGMGGTRRADTNTAAGCLYLCGHCHRRVESHRQQAYDEGRLVHQSATPSEVPVLRRGVFVLLDDAGACRAVA